MLVGVEDQGHHEVDLDLGVEEEDTAVAECRLVEVHMAEVILLQVVVLLEVDLLRRDQDIAVAGQTELIMVEVHL